MRTRTWCVVAALVSLPRLAAAQTVLSETEALARLSADSPRVRAIRTEIDVVRTDVLTAARWPNPRATFNREAVAGVTENMFFVTQPLPISGRRTFEMSAASALVLATERRAEQDVRRVRAELRRAYADLVTAQAKEAELAASHDRVRGLAEILARREAAGDAAGYDRLRAEREVMDLEADTSAARVDRARAQAALAAFFAPGIDVTSIVASGRSSANRLVLPSANELISRAMDTIPELAALKQEMVSSDFALRAASRWVIPEPEVVVGTKSSNVAGGDIGSVFSVHATVPLFDRATSEHARAVARRSQAEARLASLRASITAEMSGLRTIVIERRDAADRYRASASASAAQLERIAQVGYDAGERGILELLDAYRSGGAARIRQIALEASVRQAEIELELVSGWEIR